MSESVFVDTNVLVYVRDETDPSKQRRATDWMATLWDARRGRLSIQVLEEYYTVATKKLDPPRALEDVREDILCLRAWKPVLIEIDVVEHAWDLQDRYQLSWWDSLIAAAALKAKSSYLLSEDFQDGQVIEGMTVIDPFRHEPATILG